MLANSIILWTVAGFLGMSAAGMLVAPDVPIASLEESLGPPVTIEPI